MHLLQNGLWRVRGPSKTDIRARAAAVQETLARRDRSDDPGCSFLPRFFISGAPAKLDRGEKLLEIYAALFTLRQFGCDLTLVDCSGEMMVEYALAVERTVLNAIQRMADRAGR